jgi:SAM-dependent methyltransferase
MSSNAEETSPGDDWSVTGCPVCSSTSVKDFFHVPSIPVDAGACFGSAEDAIKATRGTINLAVCRDCGYVGNRSFEYSKISWGVEYDISLDHSPVYQAFEKETVERLVNLHGLKNKTVLEIGCGPAHFLELLCKAGGNQGIGVDPSVPRVGEEPCGGGKLSLIRELYSEKHSGYKADLVCCRQMYCLISDPLGFLRMVRRNIGKNHGTAVYFEVPRAEYQYDGPIQWNVFFEHASVFGESSFRRTFANAGFIVNNCRPCYVDDQYLYIDAVPDPEHLERSSPEPKADPGFLEKIDSFSERYAAEVSKWKQKLAELKQQGKKVVGWGAGGRGVFFMNLFEAAELIPCVVDINPRRQGAYLGGTGQKIVAPEYLKEYQPDTIIVTHSTYVMEITNQVREMGLSAEILAADRISHQDHGSRRRIRVR